MNPYCNTGPVKLYKREVPEQFIVIEKVIGFAIIEGAIGLRRH
jgi:hypothetical protein